MRAILPFAALLSACSFGFELSSEPVDLRILALKSEPAELIASGPLPPSVTVSALVVDPRNPSRLVNYEWRACVPGLSTGEGGGGTGGMPMVPAGSVDTTSDPRCPAEGAPVEAGEKGLDALGVTVPVPPSLAALVQGAAAQGLGLSVYVNAQLKLESEGEEPLYALKRIPVSPPVPEGRVANENPMLTGLSFDGEPWEAGVPLRLRHGACAESEKVTAVDRTRPGEEVKVCAHRIEPLVDPSQSQTYRVRAFDGSDQEHKERLRFAWFVEHGSLTLPDTEEPTGIGPVRTEPLVTKWLEPPEKPASSSATLWVVVRDGRGGTSWEERKVEWE